MNINLIAKFLLVMTILVWRGRSVSANLGASYNQLAAVSGKIVNERGEVIVDLPSRVHIAGYSNLNTSESRKVDREIDLDAGRFETELEPGIYKFWVRYTAEEDYFFTRHSNLEVKANSEVEIVFNQLQANSSLNIRLVDVRTGEPIIHPETQILATSPEVSGMFYADFIDNRFLLNLPAAQWEIDTYIISYPFDYEIVNYPNGAFEVDLIAGNSEDAEVFFARRDSRVTGKVMDSDGEPVKVALSLKGVGVIEGVRLHKFSNDEGTFDFELPAGTYSVEIDEFIKPEEFYFPAPILLTVSPDAQPPYQEIRVEPWATSLTGSFKVNGLTQDELVFMYWDIGTNNGAKDIYLTSDGSDAVGTFDVQIPTGARWIYFEHDSIHFETPGGIIDIEGKTEFHFESNIGIRGEDFFPLYQAAKMSPDLPLTLKFENGAKTMLEADTILYSSHFKSVSFIGGSFSPLNRSMAPLGYTYSLSRSFLPIMNDTGTSETFSRPVQIVLPYDLELLKSGDPAEIRVYKSYLDEFVLPDSIDTENQTVSFTVDRFSSFGLMMQGDETNQPKQIEFELFLPIFR